MTLNYNDTIVPSMVDFIRDLLNRIPYRDLQERTIKLGTPTPTLDDSTDLQTYIKNELTCEWVIEFPYKVITDGVEGPEQSFEIHVPRLINNSFVVEGKLRIPTTKLGSTGEVRCYNNGERLVIDSYRRVEVGDNNHLFLDIVDENDERLRVDGTAENFELYKELLKLSQSQKYRIQFKLDRDNVGDYLTEEICRELLAQPIDLVEDSIVDKVFINPETALFMYLREYDRRREILSQLRKKFYRYGLIYPSDIQKYIYKYFKTAGDSTIEIPQNVNPLVYNSLSGKLQLPVYVAYNQSFADLIDPVNTPENNNVNKINELNVCASIENGEAWIWCYTYPEFKKVKVYYLEYLNRKVILNSSVSYKRKELIFGPNSAYKLRGKKYSLTEQTSVDETWLIEPKPDEKLSLTTRQIPLINMSDSVRVAMGAGMSKQAVEIENCEPCLVASGNEKEDSELDTTRLFWNNEPGTVVRITDKVILVKLDSSGTVINLDLPSTTVGLNNSVISYVTKVKVGDHVSKGDLMATSFLTRNTSYDLGLNTRVAYCFYKGYNHEDAIIVSESFAKRCTAYQIIDVPIQISCFDRVSGVSPLGTLVASKDLLINRVSLFRPVGNTEKLLNSQFLNFLKPVMSTYSNHVEVPNNIPEGVITDIKINIEENYEGICRSNKGNLEFVNETINVLQNAEKEASEYHPQVLNIPERYWSMKAAEIPADYSDTIATIVIRVVKISKVMEGTKFCNRWGSKGEVSLILPDDQMLHDEEGNPFEMILNPPSVISRKNPSQLIEVLLSKILNRLYPIVKQLAEQDKVDEIRSILSEYYGDQFDDVDDIELTTGILKSKTFLRFEVGSYSDFGRDKVLALAEKCGVEEKEYITDPDPEIGELESPVVTGESYFMRLYHSSDYTAKVTSSITDSREPLMGQGSYRPEGQKIGEMEYWGLDAYGVGPLFRRNTLLKEGTFLNELILAGYYIERDGQPIKLTKSETPKQLK